MYIYVFKKEKITQFYMMFRFTSFSNNNFTGHVTIYCYCTNMQLFSKIVKNTFFYLFCK